MAFVVIGTIMLFVSWLFFNGASTASLFVPREQSVSKIMMVTIISGCSSGLLASFLKPHISKRYSKRYRYDVGALCNGLLSGCVSITGVCDNVDPWAALIIGLIGGLIYVLSARIIERIGVDDPIEASSVHGICGLWGCIAVGIFHRQEGLISPSENSFNFLMIQFLGILVICAWTILLSGIYFLIMKRAGLLRVSLIEELLGLDVAELGSKARF